MRAKAYELTWTYYTSDYRFFSDKEDAEEAKEKLEEEFEDLQDAWVDGVRTVILCGTADELADLYENYAICESIDEKDKKELGDYYRREADRYNRKYLAGTITEEELKEFRQLYDEIDKSILSGDEDLLNCIANENEIGQAFSIKWNWIDSVGWCYLNEEFLENLEILDNKAGRHFCDLEGIDLDKLIAEQRAIVEEA